VRVSEAALLQPADDPGNIFVGLHVADEHPVAFDSLALLGSLLEVKTTLGEETRGASSAGDVVECNAVPTLKIADVGFDPGGDSVTSCSRGSRESESCAPTSRGPSIHLAQARKSRLADSRTRNTARTA
jgi:hypothetical protein